MSDDFVFDGFEPANTTPVPDVLFDQLLPRLHEAELKVILYIIRRTLGFKKTADAISLQQFQKGITTKEGKKLDDGCGLKNMTAITKALRKLEDMGCIESEKRFSSEGDSATTVYRIRFKGSTLSAVPTTRSAVPTTSNDSTVLRQTYDGVLRETYPQETVIQETVIQEEDSAASADSSSSNVTTLFTSSSEGEEKKPIAKKRSSAKKDEHKAQVEEMYALFDRLYQEMNGDPDFRVTQTKKNTEAIESLLDAGATPEKIRFVFTDIWNDSDPWWRNHRTITSVCSQYGTRVSKMKRAPMPSSNGTSHSPSPETYITDYQRKYREKAAKYERKEAK